MSELPFKRVISHIAFDGIDHFTALANPVMKALLPKRTLTAVLGLIEIRRIRFEPPDNAIEIDPRRVALAPWLKIKAKVNMVGHNNKAIKP